MHEEIVMMDKGALIKRLVFLSKECSDLESSRCCSCCSSYSDESFCRALKLSISQIEILAELLFFNK